MSAQKGVDRNTLVYDSTDTILHRDHLRSDRYPKSPTLVIDAPAGRRSGAFLVRALLDELGKQTGTDGGRKSEALDWSYAHAWTKALGIRRMAVLRAHLLTSSLVERLCGFAALADIALILVVVPDETGPSLREAFRRWAFRTLGIDAFLNEPAT